MLDLKEALKNATMAGKNTRPHRAKIPANIIMFNLVKKNITNILKADINPQTPYKGGEHSATLIEPEQFEVLGEFRQRFA